MRALADLRVGRVPYLNAYPFYWDDAGRGPVWTTASPRELGHLMRRGELDAALLASRDARALEAQVRPLAGLGIARWGSVDSVLLLSRTPVAELAGRRIALTEESRTSRALLRVLMAELWHVCAPEYVDAREAGSSVDARLVIGDEALELREAGDWPVVVDLGRAWTDWTGLPFVYARWVVRRDLPEERARALGCRLSASLQGRTGVPDLLPRGLSRRAAYRYLDGFEYRLGAAELAGLCRFCEELERYDLHRRAA